MKNASTPPPSTRRGADLARRSRAAGVRGEAPPAQAVSVAPVSPSSSPRMARFISDKEMVPSPVESSAKKVSSAWVREVVGLGCG